MKTASVLFGLVVATGVAHADRAAAPATPTRAQMTLRSLLRQFPTPAIQITRTVARPRVDASGDMACGNVMSKSADDTCTARTGPQAPVQSLAVVVRSPVVKVPVARPLVASDGDVATSNIMKKTKK